jgi:hypothetical protein
MKLFRRLWPGPANIQADRLAVPLAIGEILSRLNITCIDLNIDEQEFLSWQKQVFPEGARLFKTPLHKKLLELYVSYRLLNVMPEDVYLDAAGGQFSYASRVACRKKIIQDLRISAKLKSFHGPLVDYIESSSAAIPLPDQSVNSISCHHSFEHFQGTADMDFFDEVQRLLAPGGRCVILPIFFSQSPLLLTDKKTFSFWEEEGERLIDETGTLPGGAGSGHFARIYSPESFQRRIVGRLNTDEFRSELVSVRMDGAEIPNEKQFMTRRQAVINHHYRALVIERKPTSGDLDPVRPR